ncbi:MAG TPA: ABC transporter permease subunit [Firmicutes bacterium]|nr:ABC transporter permease subunit [Bacillota bacterium]
MGTILRFTLHEAVRKRLVLLVILLTVGFLLLYGWGVHRALALQAGTHAADDWSARLNRAGTAAALLSIGLYFANFLTAFLTIVMMSGALAGEVESGTVHAVLARPITRRSFVLGKFAGYLVLSLAYAAALFLTMLALVRPYLPLFYDDVLAGLGIFLLQPVVLAALTLAASAFLSTLNAGVLLVSLYGFGIVGGMLEQIGTGMRQPVLQNIGIFSSLVMPADALYRKAIAALFDTLSGLVGSYGNPFAAAGEPSTAMLVWAVVYAGAAVGLAVYAFEQRDL